jgi:hypothetical protein
MRAAILMEPGLRLAEFLREGPVPPNCRLDNRCAERGATGGWIAIAYGKFIGFPLLDVAGRCDVHHCSRRLGVM